MPVIESRLIVINFFLVTVIAIMLITESTLIVIAV